MIQMAACRYITDWLTEDVGEPGSPVMRINAAIAALPLFDGDDAPADVRLVTDPYRPGDIDSRRCAQFAEPSRFPTLYVLPDGPVPTEGEVAVGWRDSQVGVAIRYIVQHSDTALSARDAAYTMKALERCLFDLFAETEDGLTARGDGHESGIVLIDCAGEGGGGTTARAHGMAYGPWKETIGQAVAIQVFTLDIHARDTSP